VCSTSWRIISFIETKSPLRALGRSTVSTPNSSLASLAMRSESVFTRIRSTDEAASSVARIQ
jgi:2-methylisocitrate lyase-like PEP mutase family enzyme